MLAVLVTALLALTACQQDGDEAPGNGEATLRLTLSDAQLFTQLVTRAEHTITDYSRFTFKLSGTTISGATVTDMELHVADDGTAKVAAGTYTLTADNRAYADSDNGHPWYSNVSEPFTINVNETQDVNIALGKPKNARVSLSVDDSFTQLYEAPVLVLSDGERSVTLATAEDVCHFIIPASGALAYTITAAAKAASHATDMVSSTGFVDIQPGYNTTITLKANPATGVIIPIADAAHGGTFD